MAFNFRNFFEGIRIVSKTVSTVDTQGDLDVTSGDGKLNYHNGSSASPVVTESHPATLTNKTFVGPIITGGIVVDSISGTTGTPLTITGATNQDVIITSTGTGDINNVAGDDFNVTAADQINLTATAGNATIITGADFVVNAADDINLTAVDQFTLSAPGTSTITLGASTLTTAALSVNAAGALNLSTTSSNASITLDANGTGVISVQDPARFERNISTTRNDVASAANINAASSTFSFNKLTGITPTNLNGIVAGVNGQKLTFYNGSSIDMLVKHQNGLASAADRIITSTGADITVSANSSIEFIYDTAQSRWVIASASGTGSGGNVTNLTSANSPYVASLSDETINYAASASNVFLTLPTAASANRKLYRVKKTDNNAGWIVIDVASSGLIDDNLLYVLYNQYDSITLISDGTQWRIN